MNPADPAPESIPNTPSPDFSGTLIQSGEAQAEARQRSVKSTGTVEVPAPKIPGYTLAESLGIGTFAQAWKAIQPRTGKQVAIKVFHQSSGVNWLFLRREVERLVRLDKHPHVVSLLDADLGHEPPYYVTDLMEGGNLEQFVNPAKPVAPQQVATWMEEIAQALAFVHGKGIIHCDLKPANILLDAEGRIRVADFGQARVLSDAQGALGTLFYMAPEQAQMGDAGAAIQPDVRWDLYALGATAYSLLTGRAPYSDTLSAQLESSPSLETRLKVYRELALHTPMVDLEAVKGLDEDLAAIVGKCLATSPDQRYGSAGAILADLAARRERRPVGPLLNRRGYRIKRYLQRNAVAVAISIVALVSLGGAIGRVVVQRAQLKDQVARGLLLRAQQYADREDYGSAVAVFADLNRFSPSRLARASALAYASRLAVPELLLEHPGRIGEVAFSPDGARIATGHGDNTARIWDAVSGLPVGGVLEHASRIASGIRIAFSPDGKVLATGSDQEKDVKFWNAATGAMLGEPVKLGRPVSGLSFSPDGGKLLVRSQLEFFLVDMKTFAIVGPVAGPGGTIQFVLWTPDARRILVASDVKLIALCDGTTGQVIGKPLVLDQYVRRAAISPDGTSAVTGSIDHTVRVFDLTAPTLRQKGSSMRHDDAVESVDFSPDGTRIVSASDDGTVRLWDAKTCTPIGYPIRHPDWVMWARFALDGKRVVSACLDRTIRVWDPATGNPAGASMVCWQVSGGLEVSKDGTRIAAPSDEPLAAVWRLGAASELGRNVDADGWCDPQTGAAITQDVSRIARANQDGTVRIFEIGSSTRLVQSILLDNLFASAIAPRGDVVAVGSENGSVRTFDVATGMPVSATRIEGEYIRTWPVAFSFDGDRILALSSVGRAMILGARGGAVGPWMEHEGLLTGRFNAAGTRIFTVGGQEIRVWDAPTGKRLATISLPAYVYDACFAPDGVHIATAASDGTARIWNAETGAAAGPVLVHAGAVLDVAFSPDGRLLIVGGLASEAWIWEPRSGRPMHKLAHRFGVPAVAFSLDGQTVLTGSYDSKARLWDVATGELLGPPLPCRGTPFQLRMDPRSRWLVSVSDGFPQVWVWDTTWLVNEMAPADVLARSALVSGRRVGKDGTLMPVPSAELRSLLARARKTSVAP